MNDRPNVSLLSRCYYIPTGLCFIVFPFFTGDPTIAVAGVCGVGGLCVLLGIGGRALVNRVASSSWFKILSGLIILNVGGFTLERELNGDDRRLYILGCFYVLLGACVCVDGFLKLRNDSLQTDASELKPPTPPEDE